MNKKFLLKNRRSLVIISPNKLLSKKIEDSLDLIKKIDKKEYDRIFLRLKIIFITNKYGYTNEFFMPEKIWFANKSLIKNNNTEWVASLIIHEAFHATQFKKGKYILPFGDKLERPAIELQEKFLKKVEIFPQNYKDAGTALKDKYWEKMNEDVKSFAYFRNLLFLFENDKLNTRKIGD